MVTPGGKQTEIAALVLEARFLHHRDGNDKKVIRICDRILAMDGHNRDALLIKAGALGGLRRETECLRLTEDIIREWPGHWEGYYLLALHLFNADEQKALELLKKSIGLTEKFDNLIAIAQLAYFAGKEDYLAYLAKAEALDPPRYRNYMEHFWSYEV